MVADLTSYPRPNVAVDVALLTVRPTTDRPELVTLVQRRTEAPVGNVLPGRFLRERRTINQTIGELLKEKLGIHPRRVRPHFLKIYDAPTRDERAWTLSVGMWLALPWNDVAHATGDWLPVTREGRLHRTPLLFDHSYILKSAVVRMRDRYETRPDPERLLAGAFTLLDLRRLHEAVLGEGLRKDTFNRRMRDQLETTDTETTFLSLSTLDASRADHIIVSSGESPHGGTKRPGRPAQLYRPVQQRRRASNALPLPRIRDK